MAELVKVTDVRTLMMLFVDRDHARGRAIAGDWRRQITTRGEPFSLLDASDAARQALIPEDRIAVLIFAVRSLPKLRDMMPSVRRLPTERIVTHWYSDAEGRGVAWQREGMEAGKKVNGVGPFDLAAALHNLSEEGRRDAMESFGREPLIDVLDRLPPVDD